MTGGDNLDNAVVPCTDVGRDRLKYLQQNIIIDIYVIFVINQVTGLSDYGEDAVSVKIDKLVDKFDVKSKKI